jgi:hypothetical protein
MRFRPRRLAILILGLIVAIQLIPVWLWQSNPPAHSEPQWASPETRALAQRACFDCHSNQTTWPIYTRIAPVSWLVTWDVIRGRRELNFDDWDALLSRGNPARLANRIGRDISSGQMPPRSYLLLHPAARLTPEEQQQLINGLDQTVQAR